MMGTLDIGYVAGGLSVVDQVPGVRVDPRLGGAIGLAASAVQLYAGVAVVTAGGPVGALIAGAMAIAGAPVSATLAGLTIFSADAPERLASLEQAGEIVDIVSSPAGLAGFTGAAVAGVGLPTALRVGALSALVSDARCLTEPLRDFNSGYDAGAFVVSASVAAMPRQGGTVAPTIDRPRDPARPDRPAVQNRADRDRVDRDTAPRAAPGRPERTQRDAPDRARADRAERDRHVERVMDRATERAFTRDMNFDRPRFDRPGGGSVRFGVM
jgi:hypothetical protein